MFCFSFEYSPDIFFIHFTFHTLVVLKQDPKLSYFWETLIRSTYSLALLGDPYDPLHPNVSASVDRSAQTQTEATQQIQLAKQMQIPPDSCLDQAVLTTESTALWKSSENSIRAISGCCVDWWLHRYGDHQHRNRTARCGYSRGHCSSLFFFMVNTFVVKYRVLTSSTWTFFLITVSTSSSGKKSKAAEEIHSPDNREAIQPTGWSGLRVRSSVYSSR